MFFNLCNALEDGNPSNYWGFGNKAEIRVGLVEFN